MGSAAVSRRLIVNTFTVAADPSGTNSDGQHGALNPRDTISRDVTGALNRLWRELGDFLRLLYRQPPAS